MEEAGLRVEVAAARAAVKCLPHKHEHGDQCLIPELTWESDTALFTFNPAPGSWRQADPRAYDQPPSPNQWTTGPR